MLVVLVVVGQGLQILPWDPQYRALCWLDCSFSLVSSLDSPSQGVGFLLPPLWAMGSLSLSHRFLPTALGTLFQCDCSHLSTLAVSFLVSEV